MTDNARDIGMLPTVEMVLSLTSLRELNFISPFAVITASSPTFTFDSATTTLIARGTKYSARCLLSAFASNSDVALAVTAPPAVMLPNISILTFPIFTFIIEGTMLFF